MTTLDAWLYGTHVAEVRSLGPERVELRFTGDALDRWGVNAPVVSGLLPLSFDAPAPARVSAWLRGLMPEGASRRRLAQNAGVDTQDTVAFLGAYGLDTTGALVLVPQGADPDPPGHLDPVSDTQVADLLDQAETTGSADQITSIAGLETKIALTWTPAGWASPVGRPPSTHIVKLARPSGSRTADLIDTEAAALDLARRCALSTVHAELVTFAGRRTIVVERYDRVAHEDGRLTRVHQEDGAQLLGLHTDDPDRKFQWGRALPSLRELARLLIRMGEVRPTGLLALTCFNLAIGNTDAHAKNISVIHREDGSTQLAHAYDVAMHLHHPHAARRFAMDVNGSGDMDHITALDLVAEGRSWGLSRRDATRTVRDTLEHLQQALADIDRDAHPGVSDTAWTTVRTRTDALLSQAPASPPPARGGRRPAPRPEVDPAGRPS